MKSVPVFIRGQGRAAAHYLADYLGQVTREDAESSAFGVLAPGPIDGFGSRSFEFQGENDGKRIS